MSVWKFYDNKKGEIEKRYPELCSLCEGVLENLWLIYEKLNKELNDYAREHGELPPVEQFNLIFFMRSIPYLISAFILAEQGLVNPSRNISPLFDVVVNCIIRLELPPSKTGEPAPLIRIK